MGVDIRGRRVVERAVHLSRIKCRAQRTGLRGIEQAHLRHTDPRRLPLTLQLGGIAMEIDDQFAAWTQQRLLSEAVWRRLEKGPAGRAQGTHLAAAVGLGEQCG